MPELPEVETVARSLQQILPGRLIRDVEVRWKRTVDRPSTKKFCSSLVGKEFARISRRGKYIVFSLKQEGFLLAHLRMSGGFEVAAPSVPRGKHERVCLYLDDGCELRFDDTRKFGRLYLVKEIEEITGKLGPEPLSEDFSEEYFRQALHGRAARIKNLLLDQTVVAGVGNIYAVESLWRAGVNPLKRAGRLSARQARDLRRAVRETLRKAINTQGTDLGDGVWKSGGYTPKIYGHSGENCPRCGAVIRRIVLAQRGTEYCTKCQR